MSVAATILNTVLDHIIQGVVMYDSDHRLVVWNDHFEQILKFPDGMMKVGTPIMELTSFATKRGDFGPGDPKELALARINSLWAHSTLKSEVTIGGDRIYEVLSRVANDGGLVITYTDITERKKTEQDLQQSEVRFRDYTDSGSDWYWEADANQIYTYFSEIRTGAGEVIDASELVGTNRIKRHKETMLDPKLLEPHLKDIEAKRPFKNFEYGLTQGLFVSVNGKPVFDEKGDFVGYRGVGRDVTNQVLAQEEIKKQRDELELQNLQKSKFFSILAHDLKNPFSVMIGYADLIEKMGDQLDRKKLLQIARSVGETSHNLYRMLEDLLAWGQSQMGSTRFDPLEVHLGDLFYQATKNLTAAAKEKNINLKLVAPDIELVVDPDLITVVIRNLVSNAIKFSSEKGDISVSAEIQHIDSGEDQVMISVADTGIGISPERLATLFDLESNFSTSGTDGETGTGLGLLLCKEFIELHGGTISAASKQGEGSTFVFSLPHTPAVASPPAN
jgi:signal transduction histidine kinase